ncbi:MAG TPA: glycosyl hydrolase, partial [Opitutus sp.]|nr:glycosyl hydrolase [Opitutus sp.]
MSRLLALLLATLAVAASAEPITPVWPEVRRESKPWTRWWWLGNIADEKTITTAMESYVAAGLGGLELTPIYGVRGYEDRFVPFLSPRWTQLFEYTLAEAHRFDLGIDLANGTGWPFGGPWLAEADAAHTVTHQTFHVAAGQSLAEPVTFTPRGVVRFAGATRVPLAEIQHPVTANANLQELAIDQIRFEQPARLVTLMAFSANTTPVDLTPHVRPDGRLDWTAPADAGEWTLHALFEFPHGKMVERAAPGGEGLALDHFSSTALKNYLEKFSATLPVCHLLDDKHPCVRAFFNDSYEVDDSEGEADWTPRFLAEFEKRRGYDLRQHLPALFSGNDTRVLSDYRETISDLLLDEFTTPWREWAHARGSMIRNQPHNAPANILDLYAASDIPEQEGNGLLAMKLASSAAHLTGKPLASAEIATWLNDHFLTTHAELKANADTFLLAGLNHLFYHGTALSPSDDPWPGFQFYASVELNPANPFWSDFAALNIYLTRVQSFLQSGRPDEDVLLYYNIHDTWAQRGDGTLPHFGHGGENPVGVSAATLAAELQAAGVGFDYISDRLLQDVTVDGTAGQKGAASLRSANVSYRTILLPEITYLPEATLAKLAQLAEQGATILVHRDLPKNAAGFRANEIAFAQTLEKIRRRARTDTDGVVTANIGEGRFVIGENLPALLARHTIPREPLNQFGLDFIRRRTDDGFVYFLVNRSNAPIDGWVPLNHATAHTVLFDPITGAIGAAATRESPHSEIYLQLEPRASIIVRTYTSDVSTPPWSYSQPAAPATALVGEWAVAFERGGPTLPAPTRISTLTSWTDFTAPDRDALNAFSGTATYALTFSR